MGKKLTRRSSEFHEEEAFDTAMDSLGVPVFLLNDYKLFRSVFHLGVSYGEHRMKKEADKARQRLADFIIRSEYVDRAIEAELKDCNGS